MTSFTESEVEAAALEWLGALGWTVAHGPAIAPDTAGSERSDYTRVILEHRLRDALARLNPSLPTQALDNAFRKLTLPEGSNLETRNRAVHRMLVDGVTVEYRTAGGALRGAQVSVLDFEDPANNDWLAVNQFTVVDGEHERRPDVVLFVNGLPLGLIELKNAADEKATVWTAWRQIQTYKAELSDLFAFNAALIASDGVEARMGTLTAGREWFKPWRTITGETLADPRLPQLQVMLEGVCDRQRFLTLLRDFLVFEDDGGGKLAKKMAGYHQFHAVRTAVAETLRAARLQREGHEPRGRYESGRQPGGAAGDRRIGVVWHTQGSGKSLTMAFYAGRIIREPATENPTVVLLTDRNDLDDQLFGTFSRCRDLLRQPPVQAANRADLRAKLAVESGGVVFTTIQKFFPEEKGDRMPELSKRRNSGLEVARIPAGNGLKYYRTARSAFSAVVLDLAGTCSESGKTGLEWRDSRPRRPLRRSPRQCLSVALPGKPRPGGHLARWSAAPRASGHEATMSRGDRPPLVVTHARSWRMGAQRPFPGLSTHISAILRAAGRPESDDRRCARGTGRAECDRAAGAPGYVFAVPEAGDQEVGALACDGPVDAVPDRAPERRAAA